MRTLVALFALLGAVPTYTKSSDPVVSADGSHFSRKFSRGKEAIRVDVRRRPFRAGDHRIKEVHGDVTVDGKVPLGTDGVLEGLKTEISQIRIRWGATIAELNKELFQDCFNANMESVNAAASEDFHSVLITISGGDGAGAYEVYVIVSRDGFTTRFVAGEGGL
jgi:hypothetical protein